MNIRTIKDLLIDAIRIDRETHEHVGPRHLRAQQLPYVHSEVDMLNWGHRLGDKRSDVPWANACRLRREDDDAYSIYRQSFWEQYDRDPTPAEISRAAAVSRWVALVDDEGERRALLGWLKSKAGGKAFRRWCKQVEGISQTTGLKRKNRALEKIFLLVGRSDPLHDSLRLPGGLPFEHDFGDLPVTIAAGADETDGIDNWAASDARSPIDAKVPQSAFTWAAKQNARRRQRAAAKRAKEAENGQPAESCQAKKSGQKPEIPRTKAGQTAPRSTARKNRGTQNRPSRA